MWLSQSSNTQNLAALILFIYFSWMHLQADPHSTHSHLNAYARNHYLYSLTSEGYQVVVEHLSIYTVLCYPSPIPRLGAPSIFCLLLCPSTQLLTTWQTTGFLCRDIKKPRPLLNEGTLAALCSPCLSAGEQCPWPFYVSPSPFTVPFHHS